MQPLATTTADPDRHLSRILLGFLKGEAVLDAPPSTAETWVRSIGAVARANQVVAVAEKAKETKPLYDDDCVTLYKDRLVAKWYFFPTGGKKTIPLRRIRCVREHRGNVFNTKGWGMASVRPMLGVAARPQRRLLYSYTLVRVNVSEHLFSWSSVHFVC